MSKNKIIHMGKKKFNLDMNLFGENDYLKLQLFDKLEDDKIEITTTVINKEGKKIFPVINEIVTKEEFEDEELMYNISLIEDKCIFYNTEYCYLLNMNDLKFTYTNGLWVPENYILRCLVINNLDNERLIITSYDFSYVYSLKTGTPISDIYNFIKPTKNKNKLENHYRINNKYVNPLVIKIFTLKGKKQNKVILNNVLELYIKDEILNDEEELKTYCDEAFCNFIEETRHTPCITLQ